MGIGNQIGRTIGRTKTTGRIKTTRKIVATVVIVIVTETAIVSVAIVIGTVPVEAIGTGTRRRVARRNELIYFSKFADTMEMNGGSSRSSSRGRLVVDGLIQCL